MKKRVLLIVQVERPCGNPDHDFLSDEEYGNAVRARLIEVLEEHGGPRVQVSQTWAEGGFDDFVEFPRL